MLDKRYNFYGRVLDVNVLWLASWCLSLMPDILLTRYRSSSSRKNAFQISPLLSRISQDPCIKPMEKSVWGSIARVLINQLGRGRKTEANCPVPALLAYAVSMVADLMWPCIIMTIYPFIISRTLVQPQHFPECRTISLAQNRPRPPPGSVQSKRAYDAARYFPMPSTSNNAGAGNTSNNNAFTLVSYSRGGESKPSCCGEGGGSRPLKCHRCGSARISLFAAAAAASLSTKHEDSPGSSTQASLRGATGGGNARTRNNNSSSSRSSLTPILGAENMQENPAGPLRWTRTDETPPTVASSQGVSRGDAKNGAGCGGAVQKTLTGRKSAAELGTWNRGWRYRGEELPRPSGIPDAG